MEVREQIEADLKSIASAPLSGEARTAVDRAIFRLKSMTTNFSVVEVNDPFVIILDEICKDKKLNNQIASMLSIIRTLSEFGALDGCACEKMYSIIETHLPNCTDVYAMKVLQIALSSFSSSSLSLETRVTTSKWVMKLCNSNSMQVKSIAMATIFQILDVTFDKVYNKQKPYYLTLNNIPAQSIDAAAETIVTTQNDNTSDADGIQSPIYDPSRIPVNIVDQSHWSITFAAMLLCDLLNLMNRQKPLVFIDELNNPQNFSFYVSIAKYILDRHLPLLSHYKTKYQQIITLLVSYCKNQKDSSSFAMFAPHIILNLCDTNRSEVEPILATLISLIPDNPHLMNAISCILLANPGLMFDLISGENLVKLAKQASAYAVANFKGFLSESITIGGNIKPPLQNYDSFSKSPSAIVVSAVRILYLQIPPCIRHIDHFAAIFPYFESAWQRVIATTDDPVTINTSLKVARVCVKLAYVLDQNDPVSRILSTLCGLALPASAAFPLASKGVIALHSVLRLLKQLTSRIFQFWPLIFETVSRCHYTAAHKRSAADSQALQLIQPSLLSFSTKLKQEQFENLFKIIMRLSKEEAVSFVERKGTVPNFWPLKSLSYLFTSNTERTLPIHSEFFAHIKVLLEGEAGEFRKQATLIIFEVAKDIIEDDNSPVECRQNVFEFILKAANSLHKDVSTTAFSSLLPLISSGTSKNVREGWPIILTMIKVVWMSQYQENFTFGFRTLNFVVTDCLNLLDSCCLELLLSTISSYISQTEDINTALGSINLLWDVGSKLVPVEDVQLVDVWKALFKTLLAHLKDGRQNVRMSSLETFFNLVSSFHQQFPESLNEFIINDIFIPLFKLISDTMKSDNPIDSAELYLLALQNGLSCLRQLGNYDNVMPLLVEAIEYLALRKEVKNKAPDATKCFLPLLQFNDASLLDTSAAAFERTIKRYYDSGEEALMQGAANIFAETFPPMASDVTDNIFEMMIHILKMFCLFGQDRSYLPVATHVGLSTIPKIKAPLPRQIEILNLLIELIGAKRQQLTGKCFEALTEIYETQFDASNRSEFLKVILPVIQRSLPAEDSSNCFSSILSREADFSPILSSASAVKRLVDIARRHERFLPQIIEILSKDMDSIAEPVIPVVLSLGSSSFELIIKFFDTTCAPGGDSHRIDFARRMVPKIIEYTSKQIDLLIDEEKALNGSLRKERYESVSAFIKKLSEIETDPHALGCESGKYNHLLMLSSCFVALTSTHCNELRAQAQQIIIMAGSQK